MPVKIIVGDAMERLRELPDESAHCCVTSPPYWGLRLYTGGKGMIGLEPTFEAHLTALVALFREVRRVLRKDGTCWLNYGDAFAARSGGESGLKPKDLMMMPARVALALQADGWWLRSEIVYAKLNPMPESVTDRPTSAHEKIYLLARSGRYFYDGHAVRTPAKEATIVRLNQPSKQDDRALVSSWATSPNYHEQDPRYLKRERKRGHERPHEGFRDDWDQRSRAAQLADGANLRNVWNISPQPFPGAHFATFPPAVAETCIKAGTSARGACKACGAPWKRTARESVSWEPTCKCGEEQTAPCVVLDPFAGSGTTGLVADRLGRYAVLIEISPDYADMARRRIADDAGMFSTVLFGGKP